jgi:tripeptide aminopeptidase
VRSHDFARVSEVVQQLVDAAAYAAAVSDCTLETAIEPKYRGYRLRPDSVAVRLASEGLRRAGFEPRLALSGGAADANVFNERGLPCANLANGMVDIHTPDERIAVDDLERMVDVTLAIVDAAREPAGA